EIVHPGCRDRRKGRARAVPKSCAGGNRQAPRQGLAVSVPDPFFPFSAHLRRERAIAAARRFISASLAPGIKRSDVVALLRRRRDPLPEDEIVVAAEEALRRWLNSRANRWWRRSQRRPIGREDAS